MCHAGACPVTLACIIHLYALVRACASRTDGRGRCTWYSLVRRDTDLLASAQVCDVTVGVIHASVMTSCEGIMVRRRLFTADWLIDEEVMDMTS
jgi:hypothetical protein